MRSRNNTNSVLLGSAVVAVALLATACGSSSKSGDKASSAGTQASTGSAGGSGGSGGSSSAGSSAAVPSGKYASGKKLILDTLFRAPLAQNQAAGAKLAASEAGASVNWVGPADINPSEAIKDLQNAVAAGADGAVVAAFPGNLFKVPIDHANMPVITIDLEAPGSKAITHLGPNKYALGVALANQFAKSLPAKASGEFVGGICVPGLPVLLAPQQGFVDTMKKLQPSVTFKINVPVDGDPTKNFGSWQRIIAQNPKALGFFGECDQDVPNLIKLKKDSGAKYLIGATSGDSPENIAAVKAGTMTAIISQNGWPEGYLSAAILLQHIAKKTPLPNGWIDTGYTVITKANADAVTARIKDPSLNATEFKGLVEKVLSNPSGSAKPLEDCRGCGITFTP